MTGLIIKGHFHLTWKEKNENGTLKNQWPGAPETFRVRKAIFSLSASKNGEVHAPETPCTKRISVYVNNFCEWNISVISVTVAFRNFRETGPCMARVRKVLGHAITWINHTRADSVVCFVNIYPLGSDLSGGSVIQPLNIWVLLYHGILNCISHCFRCQHIRVFWWSTQVRWFWIIHQTKESTSDGLWRNKQHTGNSRWAR